MEMNRHNPVMVYAMLATYDENMADSEISSLVLTSSDSQELLPGG
jgi:hypothetical protein